MQEQEVEYLGLALAADIFSIKQVAGLLVPHATFTDSQLRAWWRAMRAGTEIIVARAKKEGAPPRIVAAVRLLLITDCDDYGAVKTRVFITHLGVASDQRFKSTGEGLLKSVMEQMPSRIEGDTIGFCYDPQVGPPSPAQIGMLLKHCGFKPHPAWTAPPG